MPPRSLSRLAPLALTSIILGSCNADIILPAPEETPVVISELMYHPVLEDADVDQHEFIEIHNHGDKPVDIGGWRLGGEVQFTFPAGTFLSPDQYLVIARNRVALLAVPSYALTPGDILGDYDGELDNDGGAVQLVSARGKLVDEVEYSAEFPWPIGADALGAGEDWLAASLLPITNHRYRGRSIERIDSLARGSAPGNWDASPVDGATPGRANAAKPTPVVEKLAVRAPDGSKRAILPMEPARIEIAFASESQVKSAALEWFIDDPNLEGEPTTNIPLTAMNDTLTFTATLPAQPPSTIVRYRILADAGDGKRTRVSPRPSDPYDTHGYFVATPITTASRTYHIQISQTRWTQLWDNIINNRNNGCTLFPSWARTVPAVFAYDGRIYDARVRYQGSRSQRTNGINIPMYAGTAPARPAPLKALSWSVNFPRYARFEKQSEIILNKLNQSCPGVPTQVIAALMNQAGVPAHDVRFARLHINGAFYNYVMELEEIAERMMKRYLADGEPMGDLFKNDGFVNEQGDVGIGDGRPLAPACAFNLDQRYAATYPRKSLEWKDHGVLRTLLEEAQAARAQGDVVLRAFLEKNFDVPKSLTYFAIRNWSGAWDDTIHNTYLYRRASDGKWYMMGYDFDRELGLIGRPIQMSIDYGRDVDPYNLIGYNRLKNDLLRIFRSEYRKRLAELLDTVLSPASTAAAVDAGAAAFQISEWTAAPTSPKACNAPAEIMNIKKWASDRTVWLKGHLGYMPPAPPNQVTAKTCADVRTAMPTAPDGIYWVRPDNTKPPMRVRCDMTTDGGGWTQVARERSNQQGGGLRYLGLTTDPEGLVTDFEYGLIGAHFNNLYKEVRINWDVHSIRFGVAEPLFANSVKTDIPIQSFVTTNPTLQTWVTGGGGAKFCRATRYPDVSPGDTSWAVKPLNDNNVGCGCSSVGWVGRGAFYSGTQGPAQTACSGFIFGNGWIGPVDSGAQKAGIPNRSVTMWVR